MEIRRLIPSQRNVARAVQPRQTRMLLNTYPSAPSESGFSHQATAIPQAKISSRLERGAVFSR